MQRRNVNPYILTLVAIKKEVKKLDLPEDVKDGPAMSKVVSTYMKMMSAAQLKISRTI